MNDRILSKRKAEVSRGLHSELKDREQGSKRCKKSNGVRHMYTHMTPNHVLYNVAVPLECQHIRRFTSDGKYLITFTPCCHGIRLYTFINTVFSPATTSEAPIHRDFNHFFKLKYLSMLTMPTGHELNVDFCLITKNQKFMILNSMGPWDGLSRPAAPAGLGITIPVSDFAFYTVNIETGELVDQHLFHGDYIHTVDHAGVSLYENQFAVLSVQTQTIHLFRISESGMLQLVQSLGKFLHGSDAQMVAMQEVEEVHYQESRPPFATADDTPSNTQRDVLGQYIQVLSVNEPIENPSATSESQNSAVDNDTAFLATENQLEIMMEIVGSNQMDIRDSLQEYESDPIPLEYEHDQLSQETNGTLNQDQGQSLYNGFTQAMLSFLYKLFFRQARELGKQYFFSNYDWFVSLKMWRMQLLCPDRLLIKLTRMPPEFMLLRSNEQDFSPPEAERTMFVIFDLAESHIVDMFESCSNKVEDLMLKSAYAVQNVIPEAPYNCTPGVSGLEQEYFKRKIESWSRTDKGGSHGFAMQKLSLYLPRQPSAQPQCPYFDLSLFRYPEKMIAFQNWSRTTLNIMGFYCRETNLLRFRLDARDSPDGSAESPLTLTMTIPNPQYPFIITRRVDPSAGETRNVNFHVRL